MTEWISINENSMPEYDWVLVCTNTRYDSPICFGKWFSKSEMNPNGKWFLWDECGPYCGDFFSKMGAEEITHWMPLPELPEPDS